MALRGRLYPGAPLVHHSDRGLQYCSREYVQLSNQHNVVISMTENGDPYENALAERMNRTLKEEFGLGRRLPSRQQAFRLAEQAVYLYNNFRPHLSLNMQTPQTVHLQKIPAPEAPGFRIQKSILMNKPQLQAAIFCLLKNFPSWPSSSYFFCPTISESL